MRPKYLLFGAIGVMFLCVLATTERFLIDPTDVEWMHIESFKWWLLPHAIAGACALILGPMQFSDRLRQRYLWLHRIVGRTYVAGTFIAAPLGVYIEYFEERLGFSRSFTVETVFQASLWMLTTGIAFWFILQGKVHQHRQWMTRSFGTGPLIFLEVRVIFVVFNITDPHWTEIVVWACTASSLFVADVVLQVQEMLRARPRARAMPAAPAVTA